MKSRRTRYFGTISILMICCRFLSAQVEMPLKNPSFEGEPAIGQAPDGLKFSIAGWQNWSPFESKSPPDIHGANSNYWNVQTEPFHGNTCVGLVTREDNTWECIGQYLKEPLKEGAYYTLSIYLSRDTFYLSCLTCPGGSLRFSDPIQIRIWGSQQVRGFDELLAESGPISHRDWREYTLDLFPTKTYEYLIIESYFVSENIVNGHVLIDNLKLFQYK